MAKAKGGTAVATAPKNLPVDWEKQMAAAAERAKASVATVGGAQFLSIRAGVLTFDGNAVKDNTIEAVPVEFIRENAFYEGDYDADNPSPPVCFAFSQTMGEGEAEMAPHPDSPKPQSPDCKSCKWNQFGTADKGKGKACKNTFKLSLMHADYMKKPDAIANAPLVFLKVPPTSLGAYAGFVKKVANVLEKAFYQVVARIQVRPDPKKQVAVSFDVAAEVPKGMMPAIFARHRESYALLAVPYQASGDAVARKPVPRAAGSRRRPDPASHRARAWSGSRTPRSRSRTPRGRAWSPSACPSTR